MVGVLSHLSLRLHTLYSEADFSCGKDAMLVNPMGLASAASIGVGTLLLHVPMADVQLSSQLWFLGWEPFTGPLSSQENNNLCLAIAAASGRSRAVCYGEKNPAALPAPCCMVVSKGLFFLILHLKTLTSPEAKANFFCIHAG